MDRFDISEVTAALVVLIVIGRYVAGITTELGNGPLYIALAASAYLFGAEIYRDIL